MASSTSGMPGAVLIPQSTQSQFLVMTALACFRCSGVIFIGCLLLLMWMRQPARRSIALNQSHDSERYDRLSRMVARRPASEVAPRCAHSDVTTSLRLTALTA